LQFRKLYKEPSVLSYRKLNKKMKHRTPLNKREAKHFKSLNYLLIEQEVFKMVYNKHSKIKLQKERGFNPSLFILIGK